MSNKILEYPPGNRVEAKIDYAPSEAEPAGIITVRDVNNQVRRKIDLRDYDLRDWIPITGDDLRLERGIVEAHLMRTDGNGPWTATLRLRANPALDKPEAVDTDHRDRNHLVPSALFRSMS